MKDVREVYLRMAIEEGVRGQVQVRLGGGEEPIHDLGVIQFDELPGKMRVKERDRQHGALAGAEVEEEGFLRPQKDGADHDRMKLFRELGVGLQESGSIHYRIILEEANLLEERLRF